MQVTLASLSGQSPLTPRSSDGKTFGNPETAPAETHRVSSDRLSLALTYHSEILRPQHYTLSCLSSTRHSLLQPPAPYPPLSGRWIASVWAPLLSSKIFSGLPLSRAVNECRTWIIERSASVHRSHALVRSCTSAHYQPPQIEREHI